MPKKFCELNVLAFVLLRMLRVNHPACLCRDYSTELFYKPESFSTEAVLIKKPVSSLTGRIASRHGKQMERDSICSECNNQLFFAHFAAAVKVDFPGLVI